MKYKTITVILKCLVLVLSIVNVAVFHSSGSQTFNDNIDDHSFRFLIGKYVILLMELHLVFESVAVVNMFSHYATKYKVINYFLGVISIAISLPLFYNFCDDFWYYSGDVNPFSFIVPLLYLLCGIFDFLIAGKKPE